MYSHIHAHDDDFLFEQQRSLGDPWFQTVVNNSVCRESNFFQSKKKVVPAVETPAKDDSLKDVARDGARLFRRLLHLAVKEKGTSLERRYEKEIARLEECGMTSEAASKQADLNALRAKKAPR